MNPQVPRTTSITPKPKGLGLRSVAQRLFRGTPGLLALGLFVVTATAFLAGGGRAQETGGNDPPTDPAAGRYWDIPPIYGDTLFKVPILVRDFTYDGAERTLLRTGEECEQIIVQDLTFSDYFNVRRESEPGHGRSQTPDAVIWGRVTEQFGRTVLNGQIIDSETGELIFQKNYALGNPPDRWVLHAFSDDIVLYLTGEAGVASTRIAFVGNATGAKEVYLVDYDGARLTRVTSLNSITVSPAWSPDGSHLAFTTFARGKPDLMMAEIGEPKLIPVSTREGINTAPDFHPEGERVAACLSFEGNAELYEVPLNGRAPRRLTFANESIETSPTYSPAGNQIAYVSDRTGRTQVYVMDAGGGNSRRLTVINGMCDSPDWSPKGERIVFVARIDRVYDVFTIRSDGGDLRRLSADAGNHENPRWAPDGRHIVFSKVEEDSRRLYVMAADGSGKRRLTWSKGDQYNPSWSPSLYGAREF